MQQMRRIKKSGARNERSVGVVAEMMQEIKHVKDKVNQKHY